MGFEVTYKYHEKLEEGFGYDKEEVKELKRRIGDPFEDVPLEKLAGSIFSQYARRDIMVIGVEIEEITRKSVSFKETKGGILLKGKKYLLDSDNHIVVQEAPQPTAPPSYQPTPPVPGQPVGANVNLAQPARPNVNLAQPARPNVNLAAPRRKGPPPPQRKVVFMPSKAEDMAALFRETGVRLTPEKEYPLLAEQMNPTGVGQTYTITDDIGNSHNVPDEFFVAANMELFADRQLGFSKSPKQRDGGNLQWGGVISDDIPNLRGR